MPITGSADSNSTTTASNALGPAVGSPGNRRDGDDLAPKFRLLINDQPLNVDVNALIKSIEYESALDMADMLKITVDNPGLIDPDSPFPDWTGHKAFQPGNEVSAYIGYGDASKTANFVGRAMWAKHLPNFPKEGMPQLDLTGYDLSHRLMDKEGPIINAGNFRANPKTARPIGTVDDQGQVLVNILHSDVVENLAAKYNMDTDVDPTTIKTNLVIKKGRKHYELIRGLANINNRDFWVDYNIVTKRWVMHWKIKDRDQPAQYVFRYGTNASLSNEKTSTSGTLLSVEPEYGLRESVSTVTVSFFDTKAQTWVQAIVIEDADGPNPIYLPGGGLAQRAAVARRPRPLLPGAVSSRPRKETRAKILKSQAHDVIAEALDNASAFSIAAGGVNIDLKHPGIRFATPADAAAFCLRWFQARQDNFITVKATTIGVETLRARQTHYLKGIGTRLSGNYFFTRVRHVLSEDSYTCDITANKVINS